MFEWAVWAWLQKTTSTYTAHALAAKQMQPCTEFGSVGVDPYTIDVPFDPLPEDDDLEDDDLSGLC